MVNQWKLELKRIIPEVPVARSAGQSNTDSGNEIAPHHDRTPAILLMDDIYKGVKSVSSLTA